MMRSSTSKPDKAQRLIQEQAVDWLMQLQASPKDMALAEACARWRASDSRHELAFKKASRVFSDTRLLLLQDIDFAKTAARRPRFPVRATVASMLVFVAFAAAFIAFDGPMRLRADAMSASSEMPVIKLADGSTVQLNSSSAISFDITNKGRHVHLLRGEAYFIVAKDTQRPFTVSAAKGNITALGTEFDVKLKERGADVVVTEHAVEVKSSASGPAPTPRDTLRLEQGHSVFYDSATGIGQVTAIDPEFAASWRNGRLIFEDQPLSHVVEDIARHLPGRIMIASNDLAQRRITGTFDLSSPSTALDDFIKVFDLKATHIGALLTVLHN
ncbi:MULTISPECIES: FecR family protein [Ochrobactrum]|uniref:FecR family protein n=1 Tax=Ochrobactrum chromiisoli TaxID=2993941 RepID=A0ABT3QPE4_9HYPH|nr:FecR family protein [Ochrobactrum chromiisoli]MCX2697470.1 FecR family protein [Ochrobactrum chromiisoli]